MINKSQTTTLSSLLILCIFDNDVMNQTLCLPDGFCLFNLFLQTTNQSKRCFKKQQLESQLQPKLLEKQVQTWLNWRQKWRPVLMWWRDRRDFLQSVCSVVVLSYGRPVTDEADSLVRESDEIKAQTDEMFRCSVCFQSEKRKKIQLKRRKTDEASIRWKNTKSKDGGRSGRWKKDR